MGQMSDEQMEFVQSHLCSWSEYLAMGGIRRRNELAYLLSHEEYYEALNYYQQCKRLQRDL